MKTRTYKLSCFVLATVCMAMAASQAQAVVVIDRVLIGNAGNSNDILILNSGSTAGGVAYEYYMGTYPVTNSQYVEFLNKVDATGANSLGLYNASMTSDARGGITLTGGNPNGSKYSAKTNMDNKPVNYVTWIDSMRFVNWLETGQGTTTETGTYTLTGGTETPSNAGTVTRNGSVNFFLPSVNEIYKAAFHDPVNSGADGTGPGGRGNDYWDFPTMSNSTPTPATANGVGDVSNPGANIMNYDGGADWNSQNGNVTTVGTMGNASFYGVYDLASNVQNWTETGGGNRFKFGSAYGGDTWNMLGGVIDGYGSTTQSADRGFRVGAFTAAEDFNAVPEPSTYALGLIGLAGLGWVAWRKRRQRG